MTVPPATSRVRLGPALGAVVTIVLLVWLIYTVSDVLLLLFIAVLMSLFFGSVTDLLVKRLAIPRGLAFSASVLLTLFAIYGLGAILIPPVVEQTRQLASVMPLYVQTWQSAWQRLSEGFPLLSGGSGAVGGELVSAVVGQIESLTGRLVPTALGLGHLAVNLVSILVMAIYLALYPGLYREWLIALFPPVHRDTARDVLRDMSNTLRAWIAAQMLAMTVLAALTALGLYILRVPYWLTFGIFVGAVVVVPFFGTLVGTLLPALFVLGGNGLGAVGPGGHFLLVIALGVLVHIVEGNLVLPLITAKRVEIPPVISMMSVLIVAKLFGIPGVIVAVPLAAVVLVFVRRVVINRLYEGQRFRQDPGDRTLVLRVPAPDAAVVVSAEIDVLAGAPRRAAS